MSRDRDPNTSTPVALISEVLRVEQLLRSHLVRALPKNMELSHFSVLNHLAAGQEKTPAQLASSFNLTRGAMTNTLRKLEAFGWVHIRPDWDDARKKLVAISPSGLAARDEALHNFTPVLQALTLTLGEKNLRETLPKLRDLRVGLGALDRG